MKWFRFYNEAVHDSKVQLLDPPLFKDWVNLLSLASGNDPRGVLPPIKQIAYVLRTTVRDAQQRLDALVAEGLFDVSPDGPVRPHNWDERQPESDDAATRMRRKRAGQNPDVPAQKPFGTCSEHVRSGGRNGKTAGAKTDAPAAEGAGDGSSTETSAHKGDTDCSEHVRELFVPEEIRLEEKREENPPPHAGAREAPNPNPPDEVTRVAAVADSLFPVMDYGIKVRQLGSSVRVDWLEAAMLRAHEAGKTDWRYVMGVYKGFVSEGGPRTAPARASPPQPTPEDEAESLRRATERMREYREKEYARSHRGRR